MGLRKFLDMEQEPDGKGFAPPVFVTGCMRSGTSYLLAKMCQHPQLLQIGTELNKVWTKIGGASCEGKCVYRDEEDFDVRYATQMASYFAAYLQKARMPHRAAMRVRRYLEGNGGRITYDWDNIIPLNKSPHLMNKIRYVNALFPDSKWICIVRSIHGNAASMKVFMERRLKDYNTRLYFDEDNSQACWYSVRGAQPAPRGDNYVYGLDDFSTIPRMWCRLNRIMLDDISRLPEGTVKVVRYEDLVHNQYDTLMDIFEFLEIAEGHRDACEAIASHGLKIVNTTSKGSPLEKWKRTLTRDEIEIVRRQMKTMEYEAIAEEITAVV